MAIDYAPKRAPKDKKGAEFAKKLLKFRDGLPADQRKALNMLIGGAIAADGAIKRSRRADAKARSFSDALETFSNGLPKGQREGLAAMLSAGALSWGLALDPAPQDDIKPIHLVWVHVARTLAVIVAGAVTILRELLEDDPEVLVPVLDLPDTPQ